MSRLPPGVEDSMHLEQEDPDSRSSGYRTGTELSSLLPAKSLSESDKHRSSFQRWPVAFAAGLLLLAALLLRSFSNLSPGVKEVFVRAGHRALGGGVSGAIAGVAQVLTLMWLRTAMNYQYRHGGSMSVALRTLYAQGGIPRFYQGVGFALLQNPLSRFGDTAANTGVLSIFEATAAGSSVPVSVRTAVASGVAALWRVSITPLDTCKTTLQVEGRGAYALLLRKAQRDGWLTMWNGAMGNAAANFVGSYPWFLTFNLLDSLLPPPNRLSLGPRLLRSAFMGCCATAVSDTASNSIRVVKTTKQTSATSVSYAGVVRMVLAHDGWRGLLFRGLGTRLLANALQSALFTVVWKAIEAQLG